MRKLESLSFKFDGDKIWILDQTLLPQEKVWLEATNHVDMIEHIRQLRVRGAPMIAIAAVVCLARYVEKGASEPELRKAAELLRESRPTAVNLMNAIDRLLNFRPGTLDVREVVETAEKIFNEDVKLCDAIAQNGLTLIEKGDSILTHCNTGGLATAGVGTAIGVLRRAHNQGMGIHVYVDETRPLLQGGRLTAWELGELGIPHTLICDNMAALLMRDKKIQKIIVGCDRIAMNGDFANKVGTYSLAVLAKHHQIPFYVAAPYTTVDLNCESGSDIPIEQRDPEEVRGVRGAFGQVRWAPESSAVFNPSFDVTPAELVSAWILDRTVLTQNDIKKGGLFECTLS